ncbi:MAG: hypothetical protein IH987_16045, partial [Planctomycetes bacterium]|nr:hypothetical protein [Planctomycetota bacterium]
MRIDSNGNVGIGTIDPDSKLHVKTSGGGIHVEAGGSDTAEVYLSEGNDSGIKMVYSGPDNSLSFVPRLTGTDSPAALTIKRGTGYVGIGTTNPGHMLEIEGDDPDIGLDVSSTSNSNAQLRFMVDNTEKADVAYIKAQERLQLTNRASGSAKRLVLDRDGNVGIGTAEPTPAKLKVVANSDFAALEVRQGGHGFAGAFVNTNPVGIGPALFVEHKGLGPVIQAVSSGNVVFQVLASGTTSVEVLQITGPDLAEKFPFTGEAKPGMVVQIDSDNPGGLRVATGAYNRMVAGIVSNAGGLSAGAILGNLPGSEDQPPIALSGRVWTLCDASLGVIKPGDLLTTCDTPGHAMKVTNHTRAQGAIIGKAMTSLAEGKGLVLVLVSLQ